MQTYGLQGKSLLGWLTWLRTTFWSKKTCGFDPSGLWLNLVVQVLSIRDSVSEVKNILVTIPADYLNYNNIFFSDSAAEVPKHTGINNDLIDLVSDLLSHPLALQYYLSTRKTITFNYASEATITWLWRTGTRCLWLRLYLSSQNINADRQRFAFKVGHVYFGRPWSVSKSVRDIKVFIRFSPHFDAQDELINGLIN